MANPTFPPAPNWNEIDSIDHFVHVYDRDGDLIESLRGYIGAGLRRGESAMVLATRSHLDTLVKALEAEGDVQGAHRHGRLLTIEVDDALGRFMHNGAPDAANFRRFAHATLGALASEGRPIRAFGEMVTTLWERGQEDAALALERLWNDLALTYRFKLLCGYPSRCFTGPRAGRLSEVCSLHDHAFGGQCRHAPSWAEAVPGSSGGRNHASRRT